MSLRLADSFVRKLVHLAQPIDDYLSLVVGVSAVCAFSQVSEAKSERLNYDVAVVDWLLGLRLPSVASDNTPGQANNKQTSNQFTSSARSSAQSTSLTIAPEASLPINELQSTTS